ncbi:MAG: hypothetical protein IJW91_04960 [Phascolarctobacterium sp.]|nr:hypothetical protein [Phascolarctobacterium sp.]MBQ7759624.1 hypothetical protein [Acidaminococcaceae bacterium]MBQ7883378.1 hypothetical protein [Phascolarctobacterium sp.]
MSSKKLIAAALIGGFIFGNAMTPVNAGILDKVLKGGIVGVVVDKTAPQINDAINAITAKYGVSSTYATKVVPIVAVGDGSRAGAAQVSGPQELVDQCQAALQIEQTIFGVRAMVLIPIDKVAVKDINRVQGVGVSAQIDIKL